MVEKAPKPANNGQHLIPLCLLAIFFSLCLLDVSKLNVKKYRETHAREQRAYRRCMVTFSLFCIRFDHISRLNTKWIPKKKHNIFIYKYKQNELVSVFLVDVSSCNVYVFVIIITIVSSFRVSSFLIYVTPIYVFFIRLKNCFCADILSLQFIRFDLSESIRKKNILQAKFAETASSRH